jgi:hypothetical protein
VQPYFSKLLEAKNVKSLLLEDLRVMPTPIKSKSHPFKLVKAFE